MTKDFSESDMRSIIDKIKRQKAVTGKPISLRPTVAIISTEQLKKFGDKYGLLDRVKP